MSDDTVVSREAGALRRGKPAYDVLNTIKSHVQRQHLVEIARPYREFIDTVITHFAKGRAELIEKACKASLVDPAGRGVLVVDWEDKTTVMLSRTVPHGSVAYRDYLGAKAPGIPTLTEEVSKPSSERG